MSLLIIRVPHKPFFGSSANSPIDSIGELDVLSYAERFEWRLVDRMVDGVDGKGIIDSGVSTTDAMPYADQVLVWMPTIDVQSLEMKLPIASSRKLHQILPNLIEEYVLYGAHSLEAQVFPPIPGQPASHRTVALIDRNWFAWLIKQLEGLISQRVRLIPDYLLLNWQVGVTENHSEGVINKPSVAYQLDNNSTLFICRTGLQTGVAWAETPIPSSIAQEQLPKSLEGANVIELTWGQIIEGTHRFLRENQNAKSANFALNLLPKDFKRANRKKGIAGLTQLFRPNRESSVGNQSKTWSDGLVWRQPMQWTKYFAIAVVSAYLLHLSWLTVDSWRWGKQLEVLAAQSLKPASIAKLKQAQSIAVLSEFVQQVTQDQRRQGLVADADFVPMVVKLEQLKSAFGPEVLQAIDYNGYAIEFQFKPGSIQQSSAQVIAKARSLGLMVKAIGSNRYRLEPYVGLAGAAGMKGGL